MTNPTATAAATARLVRGRLGAEGRWLAVDGGSMRPTIEPPAEVLVVPRRRPRIGEVWAFAAPDTSIVVHRYGRRRRGGGLVFRGDATAGADPPVDPAVLVGRAVAVRDGGGERTLGTLDRLRGVARQGYRRACRAGRRAARWAELLISRATRSRYRRRSSTPGGTDQ